MGAMLRSSMRLSLRARDVTNSLLFRYSIIAHALPCLCDLAQRPLSCQICRSYNASADCEVRPIALEPVACRCDHRYGSREGSSGLQSTIAPSYPNARSARSRFEMWLVCRAGRLIGSGLERRQFGGVHGHFQMVVCCSWALLFLPRDSMRFAAPSSDMTE